MAISDEERQALEARRGGVPTAAPAPVQSSGPLMEIPAEDAAAFGVSTTPVIATATTTPTPITTTPVITPPVITPPIITGAATETSGGGSGTVVDPVVGGARKDALVTIRAVLKTYGLEGLAEFLYKDVYLKGDVDINNPDALIFAIREQDIYKTRFAANKARADKGLAELDPASYLRLENDYRQLLQSNGLPPGFYDSNDDFTALLAGDVSPQELQDRVQNGFRAVNDADPEVKRQMQELYGVNEAGLAAYFLDPKKAAPILTRQAEAAKISARARQQGGLQLQAATAEEIAARGITAAEAETGFTKLGLESGLYNEMTGEQALTQQEKVGAALGYDITGQRKIAERKATRKSPFQGGGSFAKTTGQTSGTTETGLGVAE